MAQFSVTRRMPYPADKVYEIVADVGSYPEFVPLCKAARLWGQRSDETGCDHFCAELHIVYGKLNLSERFVSDVTCDQQRLTVLAMSDRAPVKHIENLWTIHRAGNDACDIEFFIDYQMSSRLLQFAMSNAFDYAMRKIMTAFEERARKLYGAGV